MSIELAVCPFCGSEARTINNTSDAPTWVQCKNHGRKKKGDVRCVMSHTIVPIAAWNRRAPASEPAVDRHAERAAFEAWSSEAAPGHSIDRCRDSYESYPVASAWHAWQARAKTATPAAPAVPAAPLVASERNFCERCGKRLSPGSIHTCTPPTP